MNTPKRQRVEGNVHAVETTPLREVTLEQDEPPMEQKELLIGDSTTTESLPQEEDSGIRGGIETTPKRPRGLSLHVRQCADEDSGDTASDLRANQQDTLVNDTVMNPNVSDASSLSLLENLQQNLVSDETSAGFLARMQSIVANKFQKLMASILYDSAGRALLEIKHQVVHYHPPAGFIHHVRMVITPTCTGYSYSLQVLFETIQTGVITSEDDFTMLCTFEMSYKFYKFCPGLGYKEYHEQYHDVIRYHSAQVHVTELPFQRVDSNNCLKWYKQSHNATMEEKHADEVKCISCKKLIHDLERQKERIESQSPERKVKRQAANSNYPVKYLSPNSVKLRKKNTQTERSSHKALLARYAKTDITLDDAQHDEMCKIRNEVDKNTKHLETIYE